MSNKFILLRLALAFTIFFFVFPPLPPATLVSRRNHPNWIDPRNTYMLPSPEFGITWVMAAMGCWSLTLSQDIALLRGFLCGGTLRMANPPM